MNTISDLFFGLADSQLPSRQVTEYIGFTQSDSFFQLALAKNTRITTLRKHFSREGFNRIFLSANLAGFEFAMPGFSTGFLEKGFFQKTDPIELNRKKALLDGAVVIINNNDVDMSCYADIYNHCDKTCFIGWDWDNHHWLELSTFLAAHSDIYAPAHHENLYLLSRYNWLTCGPVYCATVQWSRRFLTDHLSEMLQADRSAEPLGKHIPYTPFRFRLQVITTLSQHYSSIGFSDRTFHVRTPGERLREWYSHKMHWIVPVLNDVPIRIFDALVTGGIPIVPESLRLLPPVNAISLEHILFYNPADIVSPKNLVARANTLFDEGGHDRIAERHRYALEHHHGNSRIRQMLSYVAELFHVKLPVG